MAINKKLIHFNKKESFENELAKGNIMPTSIVFLKDTKEIWTHGQYYNNSESLIKELEDIKKDLYSSYKAVDLGLPSGTLWCDRNVGAASPEEDGLYFAWGETKGYTAEQIGTGKGQKEFTWEDYKFFDNYTITKYNDSDNKKNLDLDDDAATVNIGNNWHTPTYDEYIELFQNTNKELCLSDGTSVILEDNNIPGYWPSNNWEYGKTMILGVKFINRKNFSKYIFIPASSSVKNGSLDTPGQIFFIWTSSAHQLDDEYGRGPSSHALSSNSYNINVDSSNRYIGNPIRAVTTSNSKPLNFYTKDEIDSLLEEIKSIDLSNYYTKEETLAEIQKVAGSSIESPTISFSDKVIPIFFESNFGEQMNNYECIVNISKEEYETIIKSGKINIVINKIAEVHSAEGLKESSLGDITISTQVIPSTNGHMFKISLYGDLLQPGYDYVLGYDLKLFGIINQLDSDYGIMMYGLYVAHIEKDNVLDLGDLSNVKDITLTSNQVDIINNAKYIGTLQSRIFGLNVPLKYVEVLEDEKIFFEGTSDILRLSGLSHGPTYVVLEFIPSTNKVNAYLNDIDKYFIAKDQLASSTQNGLMSKEDKARLDSIDEIFEIVLDKTAYDSIIDPNDGLIKELNAYAVTTNIPRSEFTAKANKIKFIRLTNSDNSRTTVFTNTFTMPNSRVICVYNFNKVSGEKLGIGYATIRYKDETTMTITSVRSTMYIDGYGNDTGSSHNIWSGTQNQYDQLSTKDNNTLYLIYE